MQENNLSNRIFLNHNFPVSCKNLCGKPTISLLVALLILQFSDVRALPTWYETDYSVALMRTDKLADMSRKSRNVTGGEHLFPISLFPRVISIFSHFLLTPKHCNFVQPSFAYLFCQEIPNYISMKRTLQTITSTHPRQRRNDYISHGHLTGYRGCSVTQVSSAPRPVLCHCIRHTFAWVG